MEELTAAQVVFRFASVLLIISVALIGNGRRRKPR